MLLKYMIDGGCIMWPLLVCSVLLAAVMVERLWTVWIGGKWRNRPLPANESERTGRLMKFFRDVPPSIGLLGTIVGIVQCFGIENGRITSQNASAGLAVACYTTIAGLIIAITAMVFETWLELAVASKKPSSGVEK
jgi:biopolymer transport protein ExbB/TolQ